MKIIKLDFKVIKLLIFDSSLSLSTNINTNTNNFVIDENIKYIEIKELKKRLMNSNNIDEINKILIKENYYVNLYELYLILLQYDI